MASTKINTYHCLCSTLLLATTHTLSSLPRRSSSGSTGLDNALILPLPASPPTFEESSENNDDLPAEGYTILLGLNRDSRPTLIRREDGFEKRYLFKCERCKAVAGYEILGEREEMDTDGDGRANAEYQGRAMYLLPGGMMSTEIMKKGGKIGEEEVDVRNARVAVFE
ncbi:hypothetical protein BJ875DRAFT_386667 [Amylocarpus encephaloides]|uniref:STEEP1 domain-containing protein n=1 Tax=Amylocarpus encephaloides TaxID=45428 RepID=A0A9P8C1C9_9HELO|nr:hypothetical protein BJ875DRAFT_386667 [Amylocarpus encephaloides]